MKTPRRSLALFYVSGAALGVALLLTGCNSTVQTTSGEQYLKNYPSTTMGSSPSSSDLDWRVAAVAAVEPMLRFPARIGLVRIERGILVPVPANEGRMWIDARERLGSSFGEFVPVNLMVAEMVYTGDGTASRHGGPQSVLKAAIERIRLGAARQHLDAVLIYEVALDSEVTTTSLSILDLTLIGAWAGTRKSHVRAFGAALLVDVRNGYPYGTANSALVDETSVGRLGSKEKLWEQRTMIVNGAVAKLVPETETMMRRLIAELPDSSMPATLAVENDAVR